MSNKPAKLSIQLLFNYIRVTTFTFTPADIKIESDNKDTKSNGDQSLLLTVSVQYEHPAQFYEVTFIGLCVRQCKCTINAFYALPISTMAVNN